MRLPKQMTDQIRSCSEKMYRVDAPFGGRKRRVLQRFPDAVRYAGPGIFVHVA
jgi:hypothetical protein